MSLNYFQKIKLFIVINGLRASIFKSYDNMRYKYINVNSDVKYMLHTLKIFCFKNLLKVKRLVYKFSQ